LYRDPGSGIRDPGIRVWLLASACGPSEALEGSGVKLLSVGEPDKRLRD
jgi:hypothetical protein